MRARITVALLAFFVATNSGCATITGTLLSPITGPNNMMGIEEAALNESLQRRNYYHASLVVISTPWALAWSIPMGTYGAFHYGVTLDLGINPWRCDDPDPQLLLRPIDFMAECF